MHIHWHEGLFLQPHHLQLMQRRLQTDLRAARALFNPHCFGVLEGRISQDDLADGRVRFEKLRAIMPSGQEISFPEDAMLPALDIKAELARGTGAIDIFLAAPLWTKSRANAFRQGDRVDPRVKLLYIPDEARDVVDENSGENPQAVHVRKINARFALKGEDLSDMESFPLVRVVRATGGDGGRARQDPEFVAPPLLLRSAPVLHEMMRELVAQINTSRNEFRAKTATGGHGLEVKWELTLKLLILNRYSSILPSLVEDGMVPPFEIYLLLRELLGELLALAPEKTLFDCEAYNHLDALPAFKELDQKIRGLIIVTKGNPPLRLPFEGGPGKLRATLAQEHFDRPTGYFLAIKVPPGIDRTKLSLYVCDGNKFKFMPKTMEDMAIFGLELKEETYPPLDLPALGNQYYYRVVPTSNQRRWDQVKQDKAASLVWNNADFNLAEATFTLFMTLPS
jgi:type VI secretion system ImpJ/VasE family protein